MSLMKFREDWKDWFYLVISPLVSLMIAWAFSASMSRQDTTYSLYEVMINASAGFLLFSFLTQGHIIAVYFRALGVKKVRDQFFKKTLISSALIFLLICALPMGFYIGSILLLFWIHFHYIRQHFGVQRILHSKSILPSTRQRRLDALFFYSVYLVPLFFANSQSAINRPFLVRFLSSSGLEMTIPTVISVVDSFRWICVQSFPFVALFALFYVGRLLYFSRRDQSFLKAAAFSTTFLASMIVDWVFLTPAAGVINSILLHSIQYYYLVGKDQVREHKSGISALLPVLVGILCGTFFVAYSTELFLKFSEVKLRVFAGVGVAANIAHFYIDGYVWKTQKNNPELKIKEIA